MTRAEALEELSKPYYDPIQLRHDKEYVLKKLGFSEAEFDELMRREPVPHDRFESDKKLVAAFLGLYERFKRLGVVGARQ